jgi:hypothetical protein
VVYVVGVEDELFPHVRSVTAEQLAEERRLLFVACSRARATLTLSWASSRFLFSGRKDRTPSPFLADLPDSVVAVRTGRRTSSGVPGRRWPAGTSNSVSPHPARTAHPHGSVGRALARQEAPRASGATPEPRLSPEQVSAGVQVLHPRFGPGVVTGGDEVRVTVQFSGVSRTLDLRFAPLTLA